MATGSRSRPRPAAPPAADPPGGRLDADTPVHVSAAAGADFPLHMPGDTSRERARALVAREAMRWTYVLRSRRRWVGESAAREQNEFAAREALEQVGLGDAALRQLALGGHAVVRIPWTGDEKLHWESRIFPWEYVLTAATRHHRLQHAVNGRARR